MNTTPNFVSLSTAKTGHIGVISTDAALIKQPVAEVVMTECEDTTVRQIPLRNFKKEIIGYALVDAEDYEMLTAYCWSMAHGYVVTSKSRTPHRSMHRLLMNAPKGMVVDHINNNRLDNRRANLRLCTFHQNRMNTFGPRTRKTSRFLGVTPRGEKWVAQTKHCGEVIYIGLYDTEEGAARARDAVAFGLRGEFAKLNFPEEVQAIAPRFAAKRRDCDGQYVGVSWSKKQCGWRSCINVNHKRYSLGLFDTAEDAARARDAKAIELLGDKARLNFPRT